MSVHMFQHQNYSIDSSDYIVRSCQSNETLTLHETQIELAEFLKTANRTKMGTSREIHVLLRTVTRFECCSFGGSNPISYRV
jgi:hypothetical protein